MPKNGDAKGRDERGRFAKGNPGGPGGSRRKSFALRAAAEDAIEPEHIQAIVRKATRMALEGDLRPMRLVLDRVCGRPVEAPMQTDPVSIDLPPLKTAADCNAAIDHVLDGMVQGTISREVAGLLISTIKLRIDAIAATDFEGRIVALEHSGR